VDAVKVALAGNLPGEPFEFKDVFPDRAGLSLSHRHTSRKEPAIAASSRRSITGPGEACKFITTRPKIKGNPEKVNWKGGYRRLSINAALMSSAVSDKARWPACGQVAFSQPEGS
jgi:hypothetical protein